MVRNPGFWSEEWNRSGTGMVTMFAKKQARQQGRGERRALFYITGARYKGSVFRQRLYSVLPYKAFLPARREEAKARSLPAGRQPRHTNLDYARHASARAASAARCQKPRGARPSTVCAAKAGKGSRQYAFSFLFFSASLLMRSFSVLAWRARKFWPSGQVHHLPVRFPKSKTKRQFPCHPSSSSSILHHVVRGEVIHVPSNEIDQDQEAQVS